MQYNVLKLTLTTFLLDRRHQSVLSGSITDIFLLVQLIILSCYIIWSSLFTVYRKKRKKKRKKRKKTFVIPRYCIAFVDTTSTILDEDASFGFVSFSPEFVQLTTKITKFFSAAWSTFQKFVNECAFIVDTQRKNWKVKTDFFETSTGKICVLGNGTICNFQPTTFFS